MRKKIVLILLLFVFSLHSCKEKYLPPVIDSNLNYLVVDGSLINGPDSTIIRLSRTRKLDENVVNAWEQNAQMTVEDAEGNTLYYFQQINNNGQYGIPGMILDVTKKYKLRINTVDGNQYLSDDITVKDTPPVDSVDWRLNGDGVNIYVSSHDPSANTRYYQWQYSETYDYYSQYYSNYKYVPIPGSVNYDSQFVYRSSEELVYHCWRTSSSTEILIGSTLNLSEDRVSMAPIRFIPKASIEISSVYSILVKQYAIPKEGFEYLQNIKKITEQTGSLFDIQPSQLPGNIHCITNPAKAVIGYVSASTLQQKRIFIKNDEVSPWGYSEYCPPTQIVPLIPDSIIHFFGGPSPILIPIDKTVPMFTGMIGGLASCADCTTKNGTNVKPDFWP